MLTISHNNNSIHVTGLAPEVDIFGTIIIDLSPSVIDIGDGESMLIVKDSHVNELRKKMRGRGLSFKADESYKKWKSEVNPVYAYIECGPVNSKIVSCEIPLPKDALSKDLSFFTKGAFNTRAFKEGRWDGRIKLYRMTSNTFPTGLLERACKILKNYGITPQVKHNYDTNPPRQFNWKAKDLFELTEDQEETIRVALDHSRGTIKAPTGFGKTAAVIRYLIARRGVPTLFIANRKQLLDDAADSFKEGISGLKKSDIGKIKSGEFCDSNLSKGKILDIKANIIVSTIQSLSSRLDDPRTREILLHWLRNVCKFVIVDETQAVGTKQWDKVLEEINAPYRLSLSATPKRTDGGTIKIEAFSGPTIHSLTAESQIEKGRLCELDIIYQMYDHQMYNEDDANLTYDMVYSECVVFNEERNLKCIVNPTIEMVKEERFVLVLIQIIDHGHELMKMFLKNGVKKSDIRFIWGSGTSDKERNRTKDDFKKGKFHILISSTIFDVGVDVPVISGVVLAGAGNSDITLIQRIGRGARQCDYEEILGYTPKFMAGENQKITKIYDVADTNVKFLRSQARHRYRMAKEEFGEGRVRLVGEDMTLGKRKRKLTVSEEADIIAEASAARNDILDLFGVKSDE